LPARALRSSGVVVTARTLEEVVVEHEESSAPHCSPSLRLAILRRVPLFAALDDQSLALVDRRFHERGYAAGEMIYFTGDPAQTLYVVAIGKVKLLRHAPRQDVLLDFVGPGELFGGLPVMGDRAYPDTAQAQTDCCLLEVLADDFQAILDAYPPVTRTLLGIVSERLLAAHATIGRISAYPVESRVAATLLALAGRFGAAEQGAERLQLPLTRQNLADMTGATVETVSRVMSQLRKQGLIRSGRGWVALLDRDRLAALAADLPR
jgi:CRP-like cAMP-binding protein